MMSLVLTLPSTANVPTGILFDKPRKKTLYLKKDLLLIISFSCKRFVTVFNDIPFSITKIVLLISLLAVKNMLDITRQNVRNNPYIESRLLLLLATMKNEKLILL